MCRSEKKGNNFFWISDLLIAHGSCVFLLCSLYSFHCSFWLLSRFFTKNHLIASMILLREAETLILWWYNNCVCAPLLPALMDIIFIFIYNCVFRITLTLWHWVMVYCYWNVASLNVNYILCTYAPNHQSPSHSTPSTRVKDLVLWNHCLFVILYGSLAMMKVLWGVLCCGHVTVYQSLWQVHMISSALEDCRLVIDCWSSWRRSGDASEHSLAS